MRLESIMLQNLHWDILSQWIIEHVHLLQINIIGKHQDNI
jgi:hypothetical protein